MRDSGHKHKWRKHLTHGKKSPYKIFCRICKAEKKRNSD